MVNADTPLLIQEDTLLESAQIDLLNLKVENFVAETTPGSVENYYYRQYIEDETSLSILKPFIDKLDNLFKEQFYYPHAELEGIWINKVDNSANYNDEFHRDLSKLSSVTFINDSFIGGNFQWYSKKYSEIFTIAPKLHNTILFEGSEIPHRVRPVTEGSRFTLVTFWNLPTKKIKTLL